MGTAIVVAISNERSSSTDYRKTWWSSPKADTRRSKGSACPIDIPTACLRQAGNTESRRNYEKTWLVVWNIFPCIGNSNRNWLIFFRGIETTNQTMLMWVVSTGYLSSSLLKWQRIGGSIPIFRHTPMSYSWVVWSRWPQWDMPMVVVYPWSNMAVVYMLNGGPKNCKLLYRMGPPVISWFINHDNPY